MDEFVQNLRSLSWWLSVVVVGLLISVLASYLRSFIDRTLSATVEQRRRKTEAQRQEFLRRVSHAKRNPTEVYRLYLRAIHLNLFSTRFLIFSLFSLLAPSISESIQNISSLWVPVGVVFGIVFLGMSRSAKEQLNESLAVIDALEAESGKKRAMRI